MSLFTHSSSAFVKNLFKILSPFTESETVLQEKTALLFGKAKKNSRKLSPFELNGQLLQQYHVAFGAFSLPT